MFLLTIVIILIVALNFGESSEDYKQGLKDIEDRADWGGYDY